MSSLDERSANFVASLTRPVCDALVVAIGDETVVDWRSGRVEGPLETMSITKSIVSMVVGRLLQRKIVESVDAPLARWLPSWRGTPKERITLRHLMAHTSGLDASATAEDAYASGDVVDFALSLEVVAEPGAKFAYNNAAVNVLAAVVPAAVGYPLDTATAELLFAPLGIGSWTWRRDRKGSPLVMSGCGLEPFSLVRLGQLMASGGTWKGHELLTQAWCKESTRPAPPTDLDDLHRFLRSHGLLWWSLYPEDGRFIIDADVVTAWRSAVPPLDSAFISCLEALSGCAYTKEELLAAVGGALSNLHGGDEQALNAWHDSTWRRGLPDGRRQVGSEIGFFAQGSSGQQLLVVPGRQLVVAQMVSAAAASADAATLLREAARLLPLP